jgi:hypothetical protein
MTPEEMKTKVEEMQALIVEKLTELEEEPNWGTSEEREGLGLSLDELIVQAQAMRDLLTEAE